jgi:hypothetical protein
MDESLTQQRRVSDEGLRIVKLCQRGRTVLCRTDAGPDGTLRGSTGQLRASSRGNTEGASVVRIYWA